MIGAILTGLIAALHLYILVMEMFLWQTSRVRRVFGTTPEFAAASQVMAANQGLYNGFLALGMIWALWLGVADAGRAIAVFFLGCVLVAGVFGGLTASRRILFVQALPAALALLAVFTRV
jgi:putative membrane protein